MENQNLKDSIGLRRCRSFSSAAFNATPPQNLYYLNDHISSSSPIRGVTYLSKKNHISSPSSSSSSSVNSKHHSHNHSSRRHALTPERHMMAKRYTGNAANQVLDLYIDGEQHHQRSSGKSKCHTGNGDAKKPPRNHCAAPTSPTGTLKDKPQSQSFRVTRSELHPSFREWLETGFGHETPQELAKHVVEKLCETKDYDPDVPITIDDVYSGSVNRNPALKRDSVQYKGFETERAHLSTIGYLPDGMHSDDKLDVSFNVDSEDELDVELKSKFKGAKDRILYLSEELEQGSFLQDVEFNIPSLIQRIKDLTQEKISLALEVCDVLENQVADRAVMKDQLRSARLELESRTRKLQKENNDAQSANLEGVKEENRNLRQNICELEEKYKVADGDRICIRRNYGDKEEECKDFQACVTRLLRTCSEQGKTIDGLRGELEESVQQKYTFRNYSLSKLD